MPTRFVEMSADLVFLLVDESATIRETLGAFMRRLGYKNVTGTADALEALRILKSQEVGFIVCERNLRNTSGMELLKEMRETPNLARIPFMMMASDIPREDVALASEFGVDSYLKKPFVIKDVSERISACVAKFDDPNNPEVVFESARASFVLGNYEAAISNYKTILAKNPSSARAKVGIGRCYRLEGKLPLAEQTLLDAVSANALYVHAHHELGLVYLEMNNLESAIKHFDAAINLSPSNPIRYEAISEILVNNQKWEEAERYLMKAVKLELAYPQLYAQLGKVFFAQKKAERAAQFFAKALDSQPDNTSFLNSMGICMKELKRYDAALSYYNQALKYRNSDTKVLFNKALCLLSMKDLDRAEKTFLQIIKIDPQASKAKEKILLIKSLREESKVATEPSSSS